MVKKRLTLVVDGMVQAVGFRREVETLARTHNVEGVIKNLKDGTVKIIAEAEESNLREFRQNVLEIKRDEDPEKLTPRMQITENKEEDWTKATDEYEGTGFKRIRDNETVSPEEENAERWEKGFLILQSIAKGITKVPEGVEELTFEVERRFDILDVKYSAFSILAAATVISLTIASLWGALVVSNIIERSATSFAYLSIPYILLWCSVLLLMLRNKATIRRIPLPRRETRKTNPNRA